jgi:hypothetical protein
MFLLGYLCQIGKRDIAARNDIGINRNISYTEREKDNVTQTKHQTGLFSVERSS